MATSQLRQVAILPAKTTCGNATRENFRSLPPLHGRSSSSSIRRLQRLRRPRTHWFSPSTTISTVIRVLVKKGVLGYHTYGKVHEYFPKITRQAYFRKHLNLIINNHFNGSVVNFASFFTGEGEVDLSELEEIKQLIDQKIRILKGGQS